jgi:histidinol dehydrogenase
MMKMIKNSSVEILKNALKRPQLEKVNLNELVKSIFDDVQQNGDFALKRYTSQFDKVELNELLVSEEEIDAALVKVDIDLKNAIQQAAKNIELFHSFQQEGSIEIETMPGVVCWRKSVGIERVGLYIPGGSAPLFSTVLMLGIPAKLAGCREIVMCTPPDSNGEINPVLLYTASLIGIVTIVKVGGIQSIAALTMGTQSVPPVYKIFGPGNQYVTAAKLYAQQIGIPIDMPAGPSELMVVADKSANASFIAADLLSQAEHGSDSQVVFVTDCEALLNQTIRAIQNQLIDLSRKDVARKALMNSTCVLLKREEWLEVINDYAPEHLIVVCEDENQILDNVVNAGSVFVGNFTPESAGDYASGTNHTLPTNGFARQYSGVSLDSFVKKITFQKISQLGIQNIGPVIEKMALAEGLDAHKNAVSIRLKFTNQKM